MEDPEEFETVGDEPWPCRIHNPAPHLVCTVQSATQISVSHNGIESGCLSLSNLIKRLVTSPDLIFSLKNLPQLQNRWALTDDRPGRSHTTGQHGESQTGHGQTR